MRPKSSPPFPRTTTRRSGTPISIPKADVPAAGRGGRRPGRFDGPASSSGRAGLSDPRQCQPSADGCHRAGRQRQLVSRDFVVLAVCSPPASSRERQMSALEPRAPPRRRREVFAGDAAAGVGLDLTGPGPQPAGRAVSRGVCRHLQDALLEPMARRLVEAAHRCGLRARQEVSGTAATRAAFEGASRTVGALPALRQLGWVQPPARPAAP